MTSPALEQLAGRVRSAARVVAKAPSSVRDDALRLAADLLEEERASLIEANRADLARAEAAGMVDAARDRLAAVTADVVSRVARILAESHGLEASLGPKPAPVVAPAVADLRGQLSGLIHPGFIAGTGAARLPDLLRYLQGMSRRLEKMPESPARDAERMAVVHRVAEDYRQALADLPPSRRQAPEAQAVRWMIEELRVSLFAQTLGTRGPVSEQRITRALAQLRDAA